VLALAALVVGSALGALPWAPVAAAVAIALVVLAAESFLAARGRVLPSPRAQEALVDTSALIDGRCAEVAASGFLDRELVVPEFVLDELHRLADAPDPARRTRGRRGLTVLEALRASPRARLRVVDDDVPGEREVDRKLVEVALRRRAALITTDFNLNKVAGIRGVPVLNVNELAHALRPVVLPGEILRVAVVKEGKEPGQGVAYLEDGTMVVIEQARERVGQSFDVVVTSAIQTAAGKMFFARPADAGAPR